MGFGGIGLGCRPILQEDHIEETLCEQKVMSNFAGTGGCFICGMCVYLCVSEELDCLCYRLHDYCYIYVWNKAFYLISKTTNEYIIQNLKITLSSELPVMFMLRQSTK